MAEKTKPADLAGTWYPSDKKELSALLDKFSSEAGAPQIDGDVIALIQPHAGIVFSGPVAAYGYNLAKDLKPKTVLIVGFSHHQYFEGASVYNEGVFETPLGPLEIDTRLANALITENPLLRFYPAAFDNENSLELQLPFIKKSLPNALIVPIVIGDQSYQACVALASALYNVLKDRDGFLIIASSDMSHYLSYAQAVKQDKQTLEVLKNVSADELFKESASGGANMLCGVTSVTSAMLAAKKLGADNIKVLKYANSGDTFGDKSRVVGYASVAIYKSKIKNEELKMKNENIGIQNKEEMAADAFSSAQRKRLLEIARKTITEYLTTGKIREFPESDLALLEEKGAFVTLHKQGELRGCIGNIIGSGPLYKTVRDMSIESATKDPRFRPVTLDELKDIDIEVSVLSKPQREYNPENIIMGKHGVIVKKGFYSGVFLPQVALETGWSREEFLSNLCAHKAAIAPDAWRDKNTELYTFTAEVFSEK